MFTANHLGWLITETNSQDEAEYAYRPDGVRDAYTLNERKADFIATEAGVVTDVRNAVLGMKLREPVEGTLYRVGDDGYASVTTAVKQVFQALGGGAFTETAVIYVHAGTYAGETRIRETGRFADDFDDGTGAAWSGGSSTSGSGAANLTQSSVRRGSAGYAPEFTAGHGDEAYLSHTFSPTFGGTFADSVYLRIVSEDLSTNDTATLFTIQDSSSNSVIELRLEYGTNTVLAAYYQHDSGGGPALVAGSTLAVNTGAWYDVAFVYTADTDTNSSTGNGRFRWWVDGSIMTNVTTVNGPTTLAYKDMTLGARGVSNCNVDVLYDIFGIGGLNPCPDYPLVVRSRRDHVVELTGKLEVGYQEHVRVQGMRLAKTGADGVMFSQADGVTLSSCLVESDVLVSNCLGSRVIGNTFIYGQGTNELAFIASEAAMMRNNIFLNRTNQVCWTSTVYSVDSDYNCYSLTFPIGESNSVAGDPDLNATYGFITNYSSVARGSAIPRIAMSAVYSEGWSTKIYNGTTTNFSLADNTPGIHSGLYYYDQDEDFQYDEGEDIWRDENTNGQYDLGTDTLVWTNGALDVTNGAPGRQSGLCYSDTDSDTVWDSGEGIWMNPTEPCYADLYGWYRHLTTPCMGAIEYEIEVTDRDAGGRVDKRTVAGRTYEYTHDARGQLASYTDNQDSSNNAQYGFDHAARRIKMTVGDSAYRFVYDGNDVAVEFYDEDGDDDVDRTRVYWLMPELDQRIGFVDVEGGETNIYYYLCDQVGSVIQIVDESGDVVNQYVYDAYGNVSWDSTNTFEGVENRYLFQGREWDSHRQEYYFRYRTYIPEWGSFAGPDMNLGNGILGERHGVMSYVAFGNNPLDVRDPMGLDWLSGGGNPASMSLPGRFAPVEYYPSGGWSTAIVPETDSVKAGHAHQKAAALTTAATVGILGFPVLAAEATPLAVAAVPYAYHTAVGAVLTAPIWIPQALSSPWGQRAVTTVSAAHLYKVVTDPEYAGATMSADAGTGISSIRFAADNLVASGRRVCLMMRLHAQGYRLLPPGEPVVIAHGGVVAGRDVLPKGTRLLAYSEIGEEVAAAKGLNLARGFRPRGGAVRVYEAGQQIPRILIGPGSPHWPRFSDARVITVDEIVPLTEVLTEGMGSVHFGGCLTLH